MTALLTRKEVAQYLRVSVETISALVHSGELDCKKIKPRVWRFTQKHIDDYLNKPNAAPAETCSKSPRLPRKTIAQSASKVLKSLPQEGGAKKKSFSQMEASLRKEIAQWD